MADRTCSIDGCDSTLQVRRGWCAKHYQRWRAYADPLGVHQTGPRNCNTCGVDISRKNAHAEFCSPGCRKKSYPPRPNNGHRVLGTKDCEWCGKTFDVLSDRPNKRGCSIACGMMIAGRSGTSCEIKWVQCKCGEWKTTRSDHDCGYLPPVPIAICLVCDKVIRHAHASVRYCSQLCKQIGNTGTSRNIWIKDCNWCDTTYVSKVEHGAYCSKRCSRHARRYDEGRFAIPDPIRYAIYERDGWRCQLCRKKVNPKLSPNADWAASLDHIIPQSHGGPHTPDNLQLAHRMCNAMKCNGVYGNGEQPSLLALTSLTP